MSHRYLQRYPSLYQGLMFLNVFTFRRGLIPLLAPTARDEEDSYAWELYNQIGAGYHQAQDEDICFFQNGVLCEEEQADTFQLRTCLKSAAGEPIYLVSQRNSNPKAHWQGKRFFVQGTGESAASADSSIPAVQADLAALPLTHRYPDLFQLIFLHNSKIGERLAPLLEEVDCSPLQIRTLMSAQYRAKGLEACRFSRGEEGATPETADTLYFTTGLKTPKGVDVILQCERNNGNHGEPWFGKFFNAGWVDTSTLQGFFGKVYVPEGLLEQGLRPMAQILDFSIGPNTIRTEIAKRYLALKPEEIRYLDKYFPTSDERSADQMIIPTGYCNPKTGEEIMMRCKRNRREGATQAWYARRCFLASENAFLGRQPGKWLFSWAKFNSTDPYDMDAVLRKLNTMVLDEVWSFDGSGAGWPILKNYLIYTFVRLWKQNKVLVNRDGSYAAFNTGLVDRAYEYIYAMFRPNQANDSRRWQFAGFCVEGADQLGKDLIRNFYLLPQPARYFQPNEAIYYSFNDALPIRAQVPKYDAEHILLERTFRLPMSFLLRYAADAPGLTELLTQVQTPLDESPDAWEERRQQWKEIGRLIGRDPCYRLMRDDMEKAVETAVKRASWNYRTVIPYYNPADDKICLLLPISLSGSDAPDAAMVLEPLTSGDQTYYMGHTIITLAMAYSNSRLVCRPESDWLNVRAIRRSGGGEEELMAEEEGL